METRLKLLYALQLTDKSLDELQELKGDLPGIVEELSATVKEKTAKKKELETLVTQSLTTRDKADSEIIDLKAKIEKYKTQQFQVKTNKQYDAIAREIDYSQERIIKLQKEMESLEGKAILAKEDAEKLGPGIEELEEQLAENKKELAAINKGHEEEETKLQRQRQKLVTKVIKKDYQTYERIRKAKDGKAVVPVSRNSCGGCFNRVPPQKVLELRKNNTMLTCERCGRILISDEIVENAKQFL
ncbi:MAG: C4-type zinc ribbon domain-containing protein [Bacteroidota bacterium]